LRDSEQRGLDLFREPGDFGRDLWVDTDLGPLREAVAEEPMQRRRQPASSSIGGCSKYETVRISLTCSIKDRLSSSAALAVRFNRGASRNA
jgi:hypothetical protein